VPVLINIHGGPESQATVGFTAMTQFLVNDLGLAVILPNVRGSAGYGKTFASLDNGQQRENAVKDIGALLDWIAQQPGLDARRVAVYGGSYGGYMALAAMARYPHRFAAGVAVSGISNFTTFLQSTQDYRRDLRRREYGDERDPAMHEFFARISPIAHVQSLTRPMLIAHGANDPRVPLSEAEQLVAALNHNGAQPWFILARDEGHGFTRRSNRDFVQSALALFLREHLLSATPSRELANAPPRPQASTR
jgi:dipeptidyl aminopeptidase/acylaminoacyl peptidase